MCVCVFFFCHSAGGEGGHMVSQLFTAWFATVIAIVIVNGGSGRGFVLASPKAAWEQTEGREKKVTLRTTF